MNNKVTTDLYINASPKSSFSESIRTIRTNLAFSALGNKNLKVILITSPEPHNGKSFISANLAAAYAQEGKKVLIIDADLRNGREHEIFNIININSGGYSNLILNSLILNRSDRHVDYKNYLIETNIKGITLLPTGPTPANPVELLETETNKEIIEKLRVMFDIIIIDSPPVIGLSDSLILSKYTDVNLVVAENKRTTVESLTKTKKAFEAAESTISGVVINKADVKHHGYYGYYAEGYYIDEDIKKKKRRKKH